MRLAIPPFFMTLAPKIKKGTDIKENLSIPPSIRCMITIRFMLEKKLKDINDEKLRATKTGTTH